MQQNTNTYFPQLLAKANPMHPDIIMVTSVQESLKKLTQFYLKSFSRKSEVRIYEKFDIQIFK